MDENKQAEPVAQPYAYVYEFDSGMFGIHRSFSSNERNGSKPSRVVPVYAHSAPAVAQSETDGWHFKFNSGAESFVTNVDAADLIRMGLQVGETCTEYLKKDSASEVGISKTETTTKAPAVTQPPAEVMRELVEVLSTEVHRQLKEGLAMPRDDLKKALAALKSAKEHGL